MGIGVRPAALLLASVAACHDAVAPSDAAPAARPVPTSAEYRRWWAELEGCLGRTATLRVVFYVVPDGETLIDPTTGRNAEGLWIGHGGGPGTGDILVRARSEHRGFLVRHEMVHALFYDGSHESPAWREADRCLFDP